jgi:hypothetical protein
VDESKVRAVRFLEREIETYKALALFFSKADDKKAQWAGDTQDHLRPVYYEDRIREARRLIVDLS